MEPANWHFIIVDEDEEVRQSLRGAIERCCSTARVFDAGNGHEALKLFESHGADLMIVDHQVPLLDGLSFIRFLRAQGVTIPIILTSPNLTIEKLSAEAGATRFVEKRQLLNSLDSLLPVWMDAVKV